MYNKNELTANDIALLKAMYNMKTICNKIVCEECILDKACICPGSLILEDSPIPSGWDVPDDLIDVANGK